jgi:hypothetical protein
MKIGIYLTNQQPLGTDMTSALEEQLVMLRAARDRGWDAVATGQHYVSEGMCQLQLVPFLARLAAEAGEMTGIAGVLGPRSVRRATGGARAQARHGKDGPREVTRPVCRRRARPDRSRGAGIEGRLGS